MSGDRSTGPIESPRDATRGGVHEPALAVQGGRERLRSTHQWLFGSLFGGFLTALVLLGVSHAAAFAVWALASAATVGVGVWHTRQSGRPVLPSAVMVSRRRGDR